MGGRFLFSFNFILLPSMQELMLVVNIGPNSNFCSLSFPSKLVKSNKEGEDLGRL